MRVHLAQATTTTSKKKNTSLKTGKEKLPALPTTKSSIRPTSKRACGNSRKPRCQPQTRAGSDVTRLVTQAARHARTRTRHRGRPCHARLSREATRAATYGLAAVAAIASTARSGDYRVYRGKNKQTNKKRS